MLPDAATATATYRHRGFGVLSEIFVTGAGVEARRDCGYVDGTG